MIRKKLETPNPSAMLVPKESGARVRRAVMARNEPMRIVREIPS